jgi:hypothetical protein
MPVQRTSVLLTSSYHPSLKKLSPILTSTLFIVAMVQKVGDGKKHLRKIEHFNPLFGSRQFF